MVFICVVCSRCCRGVDACCVLLDFAFAGLLDLGIVWFGAGRFGGVVSIAVFIVLVFMWFDLVWLRAFRLGVRLVVIRCFGLFVSVCYAGAGEFACFAVIYLLVVAFGLSLFCVWGSAGVCCVCAGGRCFGVTSVVVAFDWMLLFD